MNIVYCTDNQFIQVEVSMCSLFETNDSKNCIVYLLTNSISNEQEERFKRLAERYNSNYKTIMVDIDLLPFLKDINDENGMHLGMGKLLPSAAYYRWLIPYYLPNEERCFYLDTDVVVNRDLTDFYNMDLSDIAIFGVANGSRPDEIVSGTILMNIKFWNEHDLLNQLCDKTLECFNANDRINDQYILNVVARNNRLITDDDLFACGCGTIMTHDDLTPYYLLHYCGSYRPWELKGGRISEIGVPWKNTEYWWKYYDKI